MKALHSYIFSRNFLITNVPFYGNCFAFNTVYKNSRSKEKKAILSSISGPTFGLNIILALDQRNYMKNGITEQVNVIKNIITFVKMWNYLDGNNISNINYYSFLYLLKTGRATSCCSWSWGVAFSGWIWSGCESSDFYQTRYFGSNILIIMICSAVRNIMKFMIQFQYCASFHSFISRLNWRGKKLLMHPIVAAHGMALTTQNL